MIPFLCFLLRLCFVAKIPLSVVCSLPWPHGGNSSLLVLLVSLCSYVLLLGYRHACTLGFEGVLLIPTVDSRVLRFLPLMPSAKQLLFGSLRSVLLSYHVCCVPPTAHVAGHRMLHEFSGSEAHPAGALDCSSIGFWSALLILFAFSLRPGFGHWNLSLRLRRRCARQ